MGGGGSRHSRGPGVSPARQKKAINDMRRTPNETLIGIKDTERVVETLHCVGFEAEGGGGGRSRGQETTWRQSNGWVCTGYCAIEVVWCPIYRVHGALAVMSLSGVKCVRGNITLPGVYMTSGEDMPSHEGIPSDGDNIAPHEGLHGAREAIEARSRGCKRKSTRYGHR